MASTYEKIATVTASASSTVDFTSIPSTYTDLVLIANAHNAFGGTGSTFYRMRFNSDSGSNYSGTSIRGNGSAASSAQASNATEMTWGYSANDSAARSISIANIMNYANTTTYKTMLSRGNAIDSNVGAVVNLWRSTSAITSLSIFIATTTLTGTFTLYGIKAA